MTPKWRTSLPDWEERIVAGESLVPCEPIFPDEAEAALNVFKSLIVVDVADRPTFGEAGDDWIFDFVAAIFGAYDAKRRIRLIREFFLSVAKKNGKSTLAAGIMLTALIRNWRHSNELLILAPTIEAAQNSFKPASDMVRANPELDAAADGFLHIQDWHRQITHLTTKATLKVLAADSATVVGKKAAFVLLDELWEFGTKSRADAMLREATGGLVARPEGFVISISTQSDAPPAGVFKDKLDYARKVRDGIVEDPKFMPVIYEFPKSMIDEQAYLKPENFHITNPNLNKSVRKEWLEDEMRKELAKDASTRNTFLAKHLNIEVTQTQRSDGWAGAAQWPKGIDASVTFEALLERCEVITIGIDGGGLDDLLGFYAIGREKAEVEAEVEEQVGEQVKKVRRRVKRWLGWGHAFISPEGWERRKANQTKYEEFIAAKELTKVDNLQEDVADLVELVERVNDAGLLAQVGVDPAGLGVIVDALAEIGVTEDSKQLVGVRQGIALMGAIKAIERKLADGTFRHGGQKIMSWCAGNAIVQQTPTAMRIARDASGFGKIDPLMASFNAAALMALNPEPPGSVYSADRGLISFAAA